MFIKFIVSYKLGNIRPITYKRTLLQIAKYNSLTTINNVG